MDPHTPVSKLDVDLSSAAFEKTPTFALAPEATDRRDAPSESPAPTASTTTSSATL